MFDLGTVEYEEARDSGGVLRAGAPYFVMELLSGGRLLRDVELGDWMAVRALLLQMLDALGHAHARGVLHRDVKPANMVLGTARDARPGWKLIDFGLARLLEGRGRIDNRVIAGTPNYTAPEQIEPKLFHRQGPWTDLYALGCVAHRLIAGRPVFPRRSRLEVLAAHASEAPPPLIPVMDVPAGLDTWVKRMLSKDPGERYQRAADAALGLLKLEPAIRQGAPLEDPSASLLDVVGGDSTTEMWGHDVTQAIPPQAIALLAGHHAADGRARAADAAPPIPESWVGREDPLTDLELVGIGPSLVGLRALPFVGRELERSLIWKGLRACHADRHPRAYILRGPSGVGKSRLAEWVTQRAHELGAAEVFRADHDPTNPADALAAMLARRYRCVGLSGEYLRRRVRDAVHREGVDDMYEADGLVTVIDPPMLGADGSGIRLRSAAERFELIRRAIVRGAGSRVAVVWLDDVHWGPTTIDFVKHSLDAPSEAPIIFLLTTQDEGVVDGSAVESALEDLDAHDRATTLTIEPMGAGDTRALVESLIHLEPSTLHDVVERIGGNPQFAVELVEHWLQSAALERTEEGFRTRASARRLTPLSIRETWSERLSHGLGAVEQGDRPAAIAALQVAAALGLLVRDSEWESACARLGIQIPETLSDSLRGARLILPTQTGWRWAHTMVRDILRERTALDRDERARIHRACAETLEDGGSRRPSMVERIGRHWALAGEGERALKMLRDAIEHRLERDEWGAAERLLELRESALESLDDAEQNREAAISGLLRSKALWRAGRDLAAATREAEWALSIARDLGDRSLEAELTGQLGVVAFYRAQLPEAEAWGLEALQLLGEEDVSALSASCLRVLGHVRLRQGRLDEADASFAAARQTAERADDPMGESRAIAGSAWVAYHRGDIERSLELREYEVSLVEGTHSLLDTAMSLGNLADIQRVVGKIAEAEVNSRRVIELFRRVGSGYLVHARLNLAILYAQTDRFAEAEGELEPIASWVERRGPESIRGHVDAYRMVCAAAAGRWNEADDLCERVIAWMNEHKVFEPDDAWAFERTAEMAGIDGNHLLSEAAGDQCERIRRHLGSGETDAADDED